MLTSHSALGFFMSKELTTICAKNLLVLLFSSGKLYSMMMRRDFCCWLLVWHCKGLLPAAAADSMCESVFPFSHILACQRGLACSAWEPALLGDVYDYVRVCARVC